MRVQPGAEEPVGDLRGGGITAPPFGGRIPGRLQGLPSTTFEKLVRLALRRALARQGSFRKLQAVERLYLPH
jgi:hypothetical protein